MKPFYSQLAEHYHQLFPTVREHAEWLGSLVPAPGQAVLDAGCGRGGLALELARLGHPVVAVDGDATMITLAKSDALTAGLADSMQFVCADMTKLEALSLPGVPFGLITCTGNSLVHLEPVAMREFCDSMWRMLAADGALVIQLLDYAKLDVNARLQLPDTRSSTVTGEALTFSRWYEPRNDGFLDFCMELQVGDSDQPGARHSAKTRLFPLCQNDLSLMLHEAGFGSIAWFASLDGAPTSQQTQSLVVVARL